MFEHRLKDVLNGLEQTEAEPEGDDKDLIGELERMAIAGTVSSAKEEPKPAKQAVGTLIQQIAGERQPYIANTLKEVRPSSAAEDTPAGRVAKMKKVLGELDSSQKLAALEYQRTAAGRPKNLFCRCGHISSISPPWEVYGTAKERHFIYGRWQLKSNTISSGPCACSCC